MLRVVCAQGDKEDRQMAEVDVHVPVQRLRWGQTERRDRWWVMPLITFVVFSSFVVYVTWALLQGEHYWSGNYLSPLYSPELFGSSPHAVFGPAPAWLTGLFPSWLPSWLHYSPAMLILIFPLAFRLTCYYYRGAYYKAFWADPPNCAVGEPRKGYRGEAKLPLIVHNIHRYALYFALVFIVLLSIDVWKGLWFADPATGEEHFGVGVGSLVLLTNVVLIAGYTLGCHSLRHLVGGALDEVSRAPVCSRLYAGVNVLNSRHHRWGWPSLFSVAFADLYVRMLSMGVWTDFRLL